MRKKSMKIAAMILTAGTLLQFGGCLNLKEFLRVGVTATAIEFLTDNDAIFDLFEDGATAANP